MKRITIVFSTALLAVVFAPLQAADPTGFAHWTGAELKGFAGKLGSKLNAQKMASEQLGNYGNHLFMVAHRQGPGQAELHEKQADLFVVISGDATLVVGGEVVDAKTTAPNEIRGPSIRAGEKKKLGAGDVVHIPARVPHQLLVDSGKQFTYGVVKVDTP
jgi:mannose-6-phosphate isomerase-like protein (cupin superfamily)